jgi:RNA polymerase sigma factor for flagellar operon FliA
VTCAKKPEVLQERDAVVMAHLDLVKPLAAALARRLPPCFDADDLAQAGMVALIEAAGKAAALEGDHRRLYLKCRIRGAMLDAVKRGAYREATHEALLPEVDAVATEASPEALAADAELAAMVTAARAKLTARQQQVIRHRFHGELTQRETGLQLGGIRQPSVMQHERRALERLRQQVVQMPRRAPAEPHRGPLRAPLAA